MRYIKLQFWTWDFWTLTEMRAISLFKMSLMKKPAKSSRDWFPLTMVWPFLTLWRSVHMIWSGSLLSRLNCRFRQKLFNTFRNSMLIVILDFWKRISKSGLSVCETWKYHHCCFNVEPQEDLPSLRLGKFFVDQTKMMRNHLSWKKSLIRLSYVQTCVNRWSISSKSQKERYFLMQMVLLMRGKTLK